MRRYRNAKIIATLGPASSSSIEIKKLFEAGADVFRLNFSHGDHSEHQKRYELIRSIEREFNRPVGILLDLQGPKLRIGELLNGSINLEVGQSLCLDVEPIIGNHNEISLPHPEVFQVLAPGTILRLDDGKLELEVERCSGSRAETVVRLGGELTNHKGINLTSGILGISSLTPKDREDLKFGLQLGVDWVGLSFVQRPEDVAEARKIIAGRAYVMAKIEKPQAMECLDEIVQLADGLMVARGDLGVECPPEAVPGLQKRVVRACRKAGKPVVIATQMLDSMIKMPTPTRAEASDVATAIFDGADAVMLSAETAIGDHASVTVAMMSRIIASVERDDHYRSFMELETNEPKATPADAITAAARQVSHTISAACVVTFSTTGSTSLRLARERPTVPVLGLTPRQDTARRLTLVWGIHSVLTADCKTFRDMVADAVRVSREEEFSEAGDPLVITAGVPFGTPGSTNILRIAWVE